MLHKYTNTQIQSYTATQILFLSRDCPNIMMIPTYWLAHPMNIPGTTDESESELTHSPTGNQFKLPEM